MRAGLLAVLGLSFDLLFLVSGGRQWATISYWLIPVGVVSGLYWYFTFAFYTPADYAIDAVYQVVSLAIQGAVAGLVYKS